MIVSMHQPCYFPWLGLLHKLKHSDLFIVLDVVQFNDAAFQNRTKVRNKKGEEVYLTIPVLKKGHLSQGITLQSLKIANQHRWQDKHLGTISQCYAKTPYYETYRRAIEGIILKGWERLRDLCMATLEFECKVLKIDTPYRLASELSPGGAKTELILDICRKIGANTYLSGIGARDYMEMELFQQAGIKVVWQDFNHPSYPQLSDKGDFIPGMAGLDLILNCGEAGSKYI